MTQAYRRTRPKLHNIGSFTHMNHDRTVASFDCIRRRLTLYDICAKRSGDRSTARDLNHISNEQQSVKRRRSLLDRHAHDPLWQALRRVRRPSGESRASDSAGRRRRF